MSRFRWGRPTRLVVAALVLGVVLLVAGTFIIHGTPTRFVRIDPNHPNRGHVAVTHTGLRDYLRTGLAILGVALVLFGMLRWSTQREREPRESDARHSFGDSVADVSTSVHPLTGTGPVKMDEPRHR